MIKLVAGTIHDKIPADLKNILLSNDTLREIWLGLTPLARNEWVTLQSNIVFIKRGNKNE